MEISFSKSFFKSLKTLAWHQSPLYKFYNFFRRDLPSFFLNIWLFRKPLWNFRWWDFRYPLEIFQTSIKIMAPQFEKHGIETEEGRLPKVAQMKRAIEIMQNFIDDNFIEKAEAELGEIIHRDWEFEEIPEKPGFIVLKNNQTDTERAHNRRVFKRASEIAEKQWEELWIIMRGTHESGWYKYLKQVGEEKAKSIDFRKEIYDGTDLRGWWD